MMEGEVDGSLYKAILDALPVGVAFAVPVPSKHAHKHHDRQSNANAATGGTPRAKDFRFVYINERMEELTRRDGGALGIDGLTLQPGDSLGQLAKQQKKKRDAMLASSSPAREEGEMIGSAESGEAKTVIKKKKTKKGKSSRSGPLTRLLKAHKHAWRTGDEVEVTIANTSNHLVRPLKIGQQIVGLLTIVRLFWRQNLINVHLCECSRRTAHVVLGARCRLPWVAADQRRRRRLLTRNS
jgi:hypothetical protein